MHDQRSEWTVHWNYRDELSIIDGVIFKGSKIVIPASMRRDMLAKIHVGHLGEVKCKNRARQVMFWPRMTTDIETVVKNCEACIKYRNKQQKEPLLSLPIATDPWTHVATDLFDYNKKHYLVCVDSYSNFPEVERIPSQTSEAVITVLQKIFSRQGIPDILYSDNGPCYDSEEFRRFADSWKFKHATSSPTYPQSNGLAERTVQTVKNIFEKCDEAGDNKHLALMIYRSTPLESGESPAELLGRRIKTNLPFIPNKSNEGEYQRRIRSKQKQAQYYNRNAKPLPPLERNDVVRVRGDSSWGEKGVIVDKSEHPRSYIVRTERGGEYRRNRVDLLKTPERPETVTEPEEEEIQTASKETMEHQPIVPVRRVHVEHQPIVPVRRSNRVHVRPKRLIEE